MLHCVRTPLVALVPLLLIVTVGCRNEPFARSPEPAPPPVVDDSNVGHAATPAPPQTSAPLAAAPTPAAVPQHAGLAKQVCPPGPYAEPPRGELRATPIANTEPTALDPKDTVFHLYEGPVWLNGALYFSDFKTSAGFPSRILKYTAGQPLQVAIPDSGSNGLALDPSGTLLAAARHKTRSVTVFDADLSNPKDVVKQYQGRSFNSPNDLVFRSDGTLYFTDPDFQSGNEKPQSTTNVYRVARDGSVTVIDDSIKNPNGISLSPDERTLYVAGNLEQGYLKRYAIAEDGSVGEGVKLVDPVVVPDGMTVDCAGNLYVTEHTPRVVRVITPGGQEIARITGMDKNVTNVAFGGAQRQTLFVTETGGLFSIELPIPGLPY